MANFVDEINIGIAVLVCGFYVPLTIYFGIKYRQKRDNVALEQRYARITIIEICISIVYMILFGVWIIIPNSFQNLYQNGFYNNTKINIIEAIIYCILDILFIMLNVCWIWRFWITRFRMKFTIALYHKQWIYIINPNAIQLKYSKWYLKTKNTFGNMHWILYHIIIPSLICCIIWGIISVYVFQCNTETCKLIGEILVLMRLGSIWFAWFILIIIYYTIPKFQDSFFILDELKRFITIHFMCLIRRTLETVITILLETYDLYLYFMQANWVINMTLLTVIIMISTSWVLKQLKYIAVSADITCTQTDLTDTSLLLELSNLNRSTRTNSIAHHQLKQILSTVDSFEVYMIHLSKELSIELLLAFIEIVQIQQYIVKQDGINIDHDNRFNHSLFHDIIFYDGIVQSNIVYNQYISVNNVLKNIKYKSNALFKRYIEYGSRYEVKLTNKTHDKICDVMSHADWIEDDDIDINIILKLWDDVCKELFVLLLDAFSRFQSSIQYTNLELPRVHT